ARRRAATPAPASNPECPAGGTELRAPPAEHRPRPSSADDGLFSFPASPPPVILKGMNTSAASSRVLWAAAVVLALCGAACIALAVTGWGGQLVAALSGQEPAPRPRASTPATTTTDSVTGAKRAALGQNVWLETVGDRRRVVVGAEVCLREGQYALECLLCR